MNTKLITALRATAKALDRGTFYYDWKYPARCNCGSLFCALTGKSASDLPVPKTSDGKGATWTNLMGLYCPISGVPTDKLFKELMGYGLTQEDMMNLEFLRDPKVVARMNIDQLVPPPPKRKWYQLRKPVRGTLNYNNKNHAAAYMRAWADLLTEEGKADVAAAEPTTAEQITS